MEELFLKEYTVDDDIQTEQRMDKLFLKEYTMEELFLKEYTMEELFLKEYTVDDHIQTEQRMDKLFRRVHRANIVYYLRVDDDIQTEQRMDKLFLRGNGASILHYFRMDKLFLRGNGASILHYFRMDKLILRGNGASILHYFRMDKLFLRGNRASILHYFRMDKLFLRGNGASILHFFRSGHFKKIQNVDDHIQTEQRAILNADTREEKMTVVKQEVYLWNSCSFHGTKLLKSFLSLAPFVLPCAGGTGHGSSQPEHQDHSQIYQASLKFVSKCPLSSEYMNKTLEKCVNVCGSYIKDGNCTYHCMRDSSKTRLVEFCAKPKILFEFCPEYDPVDQTFQKDTASLCNSTSNHTYYTSSDIYFCNPDNCLQLLESDVRSSATTLMTEATEMNGGDIQEVWPLQIWSLILLLVVGVIVLAIFLACILHKRRHLRARPQKKKRKYNTVMQKLI